MSRTETRVHPAKALMDGMCCRSTTTLAGEIPESRSGASQILPRCERPLPCTRIIPVSGLRAHSRYRGDPGDLERRGVTVRPNTPYPAGRLTRRTRVTLCKVDWSVPFACGGRTHPKPQMASPDAPPMPEQLRLTVRPLGRKDPIALFRRLQRDRWPFFLDSSLPDPELARYSFLGSDPVGWFRSRG